MEAEIIFGDQKAHDVVADMVRTVDMFRKIKVVRSGPTYPNEIDRHVSLFVEATAKEIHALRAMASLSYKVANWK